MIAFKYSVPYKKSTNPVVHMLLKAYLNYNYGMIVYSPEPHWVFKDWITAEYIAKLTGEQVCEV
jgi:hypothetical protein